MKVWQLTLSEIASRLSKRFEIPVEVHDETMILRGKRWITVVPCDEHDHRIWEYCLDNGTTMQTVGGKS